MTTKDFSNNVKLILEEQGKTMKQLATAMEMDPAALSRSLSGNPKLTTILSIAEALNVSPKSLFNDYDNTSGIISVNGVYRAFNSKTELDTLLSERKPNALKNNIMRQAYAKVRTQKDNQS